MLTPLIMSGRAITTRGKRLYHKKTCSLKSRRRHTAGTSCKPFSRRGAGLNTGDRDTIYTLAWIGLRRELQEPDVTQENVVSFPVSMINNLLGDLYHVDTVTLDSTNFGLPCARERQYIRLRHKHKILAELSPVTTFAKRFFRAVKFHWSEPLVQRMLIHDVDGFGLCTLALVEGGDIYCLPTTYHHHICSYIVQGAHIDSNQNGWMVGCLVTFEYPSCLLCVELHFSQTR